MKSVVAAAVVFSRLAESPKGSGATAADTVPEGSSIWLHITVLTGGRHALQCNQ